MAEAGLLRAPRDMGIAAGGYARKIAGGVLDELQSRGVERLEDGADLLAEATAIAGKSSQMQSVTDMLASGVRSDQEEGLIALFNEIGAENSPLLYECAGDVLPLLSRGFRDCVERLKEWKADSSEQRGELVVVGKKVAAAATTKSARGADIVNYVWSDTLSSSGSFALLNSISKRLFEAF